MGRAPCCDKANVKKGPWSPEEDAKLKSYIEKHGTGGNWISLPQKIGLKRCGKSCRLRWLNYLRPNIKHGAFTEDEDNLICSLYISIGSRWSIIAAQLPGRTDNDIKNYWNTRLKKKLLGNQRKQQQGRWDQSRIAIQLEAKKQADHHQNYSINECYNLHCLPPPQLISYASQETQIHEQASRSLTDQILVTPPIESRLCYNHSQHKGGNFEDFSFNPDVSCVEDQQAASNSSIRLFPTVVLNSRPHPLGCDYQAHGVIEANDFQGFDWIPDGILYNTMQQQLEGLDGLNVVDVINSSKITTAASEDGTISWGDINSVLYSSSLTNTNSGACQQRMPQDWTCFDEARLLGHSQQHHFGKFNAKC